jgi:hypothetical protein
MPEFGLPTVEPVIPPDTYRSRLRALIKQAAEEGYDVFAVYGDREHYANIAYLTGYDPRFEEALLLMNVRRPDAKPILLVGNEGIGYRHQPHKGGHRGRPIPELQPSGAAKGQQPEPGGDT